MKKLLIMILTISSLVSFSETNKKLEEDVDSAIKTFVMKTIEVNKKEEEIERKKIEVEESRKLNDLEIISGANEAAKNITATFNYYSKSMYRIFLKQNYTTTIKLNDDEDIVYIGGGDTENFVIDTAQAGVNNNWYVLIKPLFDNVKTNLNIFTNKRTYFLQIESTYDKYNPVIDFKYPFDSNLNILKKRMISNVTEVNESKEEKLNTISIDKLNYNYDFSKKYSFSPKQVFDDGVKTYIVFDEKTQEFPVVFGYSDKELVLVQSRMINKNTMSIDKISDKWDLKLGKEVLRIFRK